MATPRADGTKPTGWPELLHGALSDDASGACEIVRRLGKDLGWLRVALQQQTRHLTHQETQAEADRLNAMGRAAHPSWIGPHPDVRRVYLALPEPTDDHGAVRLDEHDGTTLRIANLFAADPGFGFTLMVAGPVWDHQLTFEPDNARRMHGEQADDVLVTIDFADGSTVDNTDRHTYGYAIGDPPAGRVVAVGEQGNSRSGTHATAECALWSWPLPPPGPVTIDVTWAHRSLHGRLVLSGDDLLAAATRGSRRGADDFELVATWVPPDFVLQRSPSTRASPASPSGRRTACMSRPSDMASPPSSSGSSSPASPAQADHLGAGMCIGRTSEVGWPPGAPCLPGATAASPCHHALSHDCGPLRRSGVKTTRVVTAERGRSPLGAYIRFLVDGPHGNMIHSTVPPGMVGRACRFRTVDEYWFVLSGEGEIWRRAADGRESITPLIPGVCVDVPLGTAFQYRCTGDVPLVFTCTAMPPWPGDDEALLVDGPWTPSVDVEPPGASS